MNDENKKDLNECKERFILIIFLRRKNDFSYDYDKRKLKFVIGSSI